MERVGYQSLNAAPNDIFADENPPEAQEHDVMFHMVPDTNKNTRWNHIEDLDSFFSRIYYYHQNHGYLCIILQECFELLQFIFIVCFATFLLECVDYPLLFRNTNTTDIHQKITIPEVIRPVGECVNGFSFPIWLTLIIALIFWTVRLIRVVRNTFLNLEIRAFYQTALNIQDNDLDNLTWYDVQKRLRDVQREQQMCIHKQELTELDIYHRILRFKNYMIAMMNKQLLPVRFSMPFVGDIIFLTHGLKYNFEMILFWGPWAPFENNWHLKEDFKKVAKRKELAQSLASRILWVGLANLILAPVIFLWQILYSFFSYAENVKREPGALGVRQWSRYGRVYLRHFNELEHEFSGRLVRAYRPAFKYMGIFNSPLMTVIAKNVVFITGAMLAVLTALTIWDEDVITVQHVLLVVTVLGSAMAIFRGFIPDEHLIWCPEKLLTAVLAHVHYFPDHWKGQAHTNKTRDQFAFLFQYKVVYLVEELLSPVVTPIILLFYLRPKALEIVDFYRNFTVEVVGVGDVCSFAQMDVRKHGNPTWQAQANEMDTSDADHEQLNNNAYTQAENGKTELSLVHFTHTNPDWRPPQDSGNYIANLKERAVRDATNLPTVLEENPLFSSLNSISSLGGDCCSVVNKFMHDRSLMHLSGPPGLGASIILNGPASIGVDQQQLLLQQQQPQGQHVSFRGFLSRHEGPVFGPARGIVSGIHHSGSSGVQTGSVFPQSNNISFANSFAHYPYQNQQSVMPSQVFRSPQQGGSDLDSLNLEGSSLNMCVDALYIHELHHQELRRRHIRNSSMGAIHNQSYSTYQGQGHGQGFSQHQHHQPLLHQTQYQSQQQQLFSPGSQTHPSSHGNNPLPPQPQLQQSQLQQSTVNKSSSEKTPLLQTGSSHHSHPFS